MYNLLPLIRCWLCLSKEFKLVNNENWLNQPYVRSPFPNYSICDGEFCTNLLLAMSKRIPKIPYAQLAYHSIHSYINDGTYPINSTFQYIIDWKINNNLNIRLFIALLDWGITPYMLEEYTLSQLLDHALRICTEDTSEWPYFLLNRSQLDTFMRTKVVNEHQPELDSDPCAWLPTPLIPSFQSLDKKKLTQEMVRD